MAQCSGKPLAIAKYIQDSAKMMDDRGSPVPVSEGWAEEDGMTQLLPEDGGDWWDLGRRKDPPADTLAYLMFRWALFECPVRYFTMCPIQLSYRYLGKDASQGGRLFCKRGGPCGAHC